MISERPRKARYHVKIVQDHEQEKEDEAKKMGPNVDCLVAPYEKATGRRGQNYKSNSLRTRTTSFKNN